MYVHRGIFDLFQKHKNQSDLYEAICDLVIDVIADTKGEDNVHFYEILRHLSTSINNAGWEERHSEQIDFINKNLQVISNEYEKYLP